MAVAWRVQKSRMAQFQFWNHMDPYYFQSLASCHEASSELALRDAPLVLTSSMLYHTLQGITTTFPGKEVLLDHAISEAASR
jgi:hypothetical protein